MKLLNKIKKNQRRIVKFQIVDRSYLFVKSVFQMTVVMPPMPELKGFMQKKIKVNLNADRIVSGVLIGYDHFMNLSIQNAKLEIPGTIPTKVDRLLVRGACIQSFTELLE